MPCYGEGLDQSRRWRVQVVTVQEGDAFLMYIPGSSMRVSYGIDHTAEARVIGTQWASWSALDVENEHYKWTIAPARSYVTSPQVREIHGLSSWVTLKICFTCIQQPA